MQHNRNGSNKEGNVNLNGDRRPHIVPAPRKRKKVVPFPAEDFNSLRGELIALKATVEVQARSMEMLGKALADVVQAVLSPSKGIETPPEQKCAEPASANVMPSSPGTPKADKARKSNAPALCNELVRVLLDPDVVAVLNGGVSPSYWEKKPRVHVTDHSFLFFSHGRICASAYGTTKAKKGYLSQYVLGMLFQLGDALKGHSPVLAEVIANTRFNSVGLTEEEILFEREVRTRPRYEVEAEREIETLRKAGVEMKEPK